MKGYKDAVKFESTKELSKVIDNYCDTNNIFSFNYNEFEIVLLNNNSRLMKVRVIINETSVDNSDLFRVLQRNISPAEPKKATVYQKFFNVQFEKPKEPVKCFLPPYFDGNGNHVGGGMPGHSYPNFKTNPEAYDGKL